MTRPPSGAPVIRADYENIAAELERFAEMPRDRPELNHNAAERLLRIARDIRSDVARVATAGTQPPAAAPR